VNSVAVAIAPTGFAAPRRLSLMQRVRADRALPDPAPPGRGRHIEVLAHGADAAALALGVHSVHCMTDTIDVLQILSSQHSEVEELFERIENGNGDRAALFVQLADKLAAHAAVEEKIFYPAAMATQTSELLHESVEEHLEIKRLLADMLALDPSGDEETFDAKLSVLKENVSHHAHEEEEGKLFPMLRRLLSADQRAALGNDVLAMFESMIDQSPRLHVPEETAEAAPLPSV
jgi:hypothetical protein